MSAGCKFYLDDIWDTAAKTEQEAWILLENLHLAPPEVLKDLTKQLKRALPSRGKMDDDIKRVDCAVAYFIRILICT